MVQNFNGNDKGDIISCFVVFLDIELKYKIIIKMSDNYENRFKFRP
jgi:hypothetical protein